MKNALKYSLLVLALALTVSTKAHARDDGWDHRKHEPEPQPPSCDNQAPEVDPSLAFGGLTLLAGTITVMRSRRSK